MAVPSFIGPSSLTFMTMARELVTGTPSGSTPSTTLPLDPNDYSPEDVPKFLPDEAIRGVMAPLFNEIRGVESAEFSFGGPVFMDAEGFMLDNVFGDMSTTSNGTLGTAPVLGSAIAVGATQVTASASIGASVPVGSVIQIGDGAASEIVIATSGSTGTSINFVNTPTRFAHSTSATVALESAATTYTHKFAILNLGNGQPPTHTMTDYTGLQTAPGGPTNTSGARQYPSYCCSQLDFSGNTEQLLMRKAAGMGWQSLAATTKPVAGTTFDLPQANWRSTVTIGGTPINDITNWAISIKRKLQTYWTATNTQTPFVIARGGLGATWTFDWGVAENELPLQEMLTSGYLSVVTALDNGLSGASHLNITLTTTTAQAVKAKPERTAVLIGYSNSMEAVANTTDAGGSGGIGPVTVSLTNAVPTY